MKRFLALAGLALAALIGSFSISAPAHASVSCSTTTSGQFPDNQYWYCGFTSGYKSAMQGSFTRLGADSKTKLTAAPANHQFYAFKSQNDYDTTCSPTTIPCGQTLAANEQGRTWTQGATYTLVLEDNQGSSDPSVISTRLVTTMAHEAGHHLDPIYGPVSGAAFASFAGTDFDNKLSIDITKFNALATAKCTAVGLYTSQFDQNGNLICSSNQTATIGGTASTGNITLTIIDPTLTGGQVIIIQPVTAGQSTTTIATNLKNAINGVPQLTTAGITATSSGAVVTMISATGKKTTYTRTISGTETVTIPGSPLFGTGTALAKAYLGQTTNWQIVQLAWPHYFTQVSNRWAELYAEETAVDFGSSENGTNQTPDLYIKNDGFVCTKLIVTHLTADGRLPTAAEYTSSHCP